MDGVVGSGNSAHKRLRPSGGYRTLNSFQAATVIYDATVAFCARFVDSRSRTRDQMVQAARSGRQNIAEGSRAAATSSQTELRLINVARASLDELLLDYEDYLRQNGQAQWTKDSPEAVTVRLVGKKRANRADQTERTDQSDPTTDYRHWLEHDNPAIIANAIICLIHQANYLLDRQIQALEKQFVAHGGYREQLATARLREREKTGPEDQAEAPRCPLCGGLMAVRTARKGVHKVSSVQRNSTIMRCFTP
jgi:restriction system protein